MADKEWTIMIFFATDNALSPLVVSQLKAIKDAGFHPDVDVLIHFDSNEVGVPTRVFDVNRRRKRGMRAQVGDGRDSFVRDLTDDAVDPEELSSDTDTATGKLRAALERRDRSNAADALRNFIGFCRENLSRDNHRAKNYILVLVGHGLVVGNDAFLPDDDPVSAIRLDELQDIVKGFTDAIKTDESKENPGGGVLQLLALHSCAMSAIEVAYQLKGTARFMIGSEGVSFIDSWPYRQMLKRILNFVDRVKGGEARREDDKTTEFDKRPGDEYANDPRDLIERLYFHLLFNATDFMLSGYSLDLCLCNLDPDNFGTLTKNIRALASGMTRVLEYEQSRELILLAHWESQSYWNETYTDLFDFCFCLHRRCRLALGLSEYGAEEETEGTEFGELVKACTGVMTELDRERSKELEERFSKIVVHACHFGPKYQYSHGLSVYFPWSRPLDDDPPTNIPLPLQARQSEPGKNSRGILSRYGSYAFNQELGRDTNNDESWIRFLEAYFDRTQRQTRRTEEKGAYNRDDGEVDSFHVRGFFNSFGGQSDNPFPALDDKVGGRVGASCSCPSIKNYPPEEIITPRGKRYVSRVTASSIVLRRFRPPE